jgi:drug/metabolite transporter (DMT)-like permease
VKKESILADAGLLYAAAIWGSTFYIVKDGLQSLTPLSIVAYRFMLAAVLLLAWLLFKKKNPLKNSLRGIILGAILWSLYIPQTVGLQFTSASNSGFITGLFVAFLPPLYWMFFRRIPPIQRQLAVVISLIGLWILTGGLVEINTGDLLTLGGALFYALHILVADRYVKKGTDLLVLSFQQFFYRRYA